MKTRKVRNGGTGTTVKLQDLKYFKRTAGGATTYPLAEQTAYQSDASGGSDGVTTRTVTRGIPERCKLIR